MPIQVFTGRLQQRFSTLVAITATNPILLEGEVWIEKNAATGRSTGRRKVGDGVVSGSTIAGTAFNDLPFEPGGGGSGSGDVVGPASSTDGRAALFDGTTGKLLKQSAAAPVFEGDTRLSNARTPTAHAASHGSGGSDAITVAQSQVTGLSAALSGKEAAGAAAGAVSAHESAADPHAQYLTQAEGDSRYRQSSTPLTDGDIPSGIARDSEVASAISAHESAADPHSQYLTQTEGDGRYRQSATALTDGDIPSGIARDSEVVAAIGAHEAAADPHPSYLTAAEGNAAYATAAQGVTNGNSHNHDGGDGAQIAYGSLSGLPSIPAPADAAPQALGATAAIGSSTDYAREDHVHALPPLASGGTAGLMSVDQNNRLAIALVSNPVGITGADAVTNIVSLTQAEYEAIATPNAATLYVITD
jgi:hypothetical protein